MVVDMSKMTPAAPPCMTSSGASEGSIKSVLRIGHTVQIGEAGRDIELVLHRAFGTSVYNLHVVHDLAIEVLHYISFYYKQY